MKKGFIWQMIIAIGLMLAVGCSGDKQEAASGQYAEFEAFYERFHTDSLFQMERIIFPLQGLPEKADSLNISSGEFYWKQEDWIMHRHANLEKSGFERKFIPISDEIIVEQIIHRNGQMGMLRRFAKIDGEWRLIYYAALNRIKGQGMG